ncbi:cryptococcal mannosyltransferase 1-domain-containing protein [Amylostereum chailletii]|nr:cryptococcal mannosyltransferase 1-domain-containing protein [Amylostereum chailletii]
MAITFRRRNVTRIILVVLVAFVFRFFFFSSSSSSTDSLNEIQRQNVLELVSRSTGKLDARRHKFLQSRMGRDERKDLMTDIVYNGVDDYWDRFQKPYIVGKDTAAMDAQSVMSSIDQLLSLNGWVAALCPTLTRPFGQNTHDSAYDELASKNHLYFIGIAIHSADHFLVDQLSVIVQLAKRLGPTNLFVSMLDYESTDSTATLTDLSEAVLILLGVPYRIRRVPGMTSDPAEAYYPLEEAHMRNLALEPLKELYERRQIKFHRVIWLKGFTCPNDILETIKVSEANDAAMVCGMDWAEHEGFFIFSDRWRTRDINGDQFRQSRSSSTPDGVPPRDKTGATRYSQHLPFQVFCCESGTHVVDPAQSYYQGISYRAGTDFHNMSSKETAPLRHANAQCLDSTQAWFCRDLWLSKAREGMADIDIGEAPAMRKRDLQDGLIKEFPHRQPVKGDDDPDANAGSDYDAMPDSDVPLEDIPAAKLSIPNSAFRPARILVNPRCVTTYAGVSHTQLALDLFGAEGESHKSDVGGKYVLEDWEGAPESFVCQEQRKTGGRGATKTQRRLGFSIHEALRDA